MKTKEFIINEDDNERLDAIYCFLKAIESDLKRHTIEEILLTNLELKNYE